jgi:hypothetical protein
MNIRFAVVVSIIASIAATAEPNPKAIQDYVSNGVGYSNLPAPEVLEMEDVDRWARMIRASDQQHTFMRIQFERFVAAHDALLDREVPRLLGQSAAVARAQQSGAAPDDFARAVHALTTSSRNILNECERIENEYIDSISAGLTDEQATRVSLLRNESSRRESRSFQFFARWTNVDLRLVWESMNRDDFATEQCEALEHVLEDYETQITPQLHRMAQVYWDGASDMSILVVQQSAGQLDSSSFQHKYHELWNRFSDASDLVRETTEKTLQIIETLGQPISEAFTAQAKIAAFPELYPDLEEVGSVLQKLLADTAISDDQRARIEALNLRYKHDYAQASKEAEAVCIQWDNKRSRGTSGYQTQFREQALQPLLQKRNDNSRQARAETQDIVGKDMLQMTMRAIKRPERTTTLSKATDAGLGTPRLPPKTTAASTPSHQ